jgi:hypothetical protein
MGFPTNSVKTYGSAALTALLVLAVVATVLGTVSSVLTTIDVTTLPDYIASTVCFFQTAFSVPMVAFVIVFIRNLYGFLKVKLKSELTQNTEVNYSVKKLGETMAIYLPVATILFATCPEPYNLIIMGIITVVDIVKGELLSLVAPALASATTQSEPST